MIYDIRKKLVYKIFRKAIAAKRIRKMKNFLKFYMVLRRRQKIKKVIKGVCSRVIKKQAQKIIVNSQNKFMFKAKE